MKYSETPAFCVVKVTDWVLVVECVQKVLCNINIKAQTKNKGTNTKNKGTNTKAQTKKLV